MRDTTGRTVIEDPRCAECNARVQSATRDKDGTTRWYPCGHDAGLIARIVNPTVGLFERVACVCFAVAAVLYVIVGVVVSAQGYPAVLAIVFPIAAVFAWGAWVLATE